MPILEIEIVLHPGEVLRPNLAADLADRGAAALRAAPGHTWVRLRSLPAGQYAEDDGGPPPDVWPVFVTVLHAHRPPGEALRDEARRLTEAIAAGCDRPAANVHLIYQPDGAGRVAFGGRLVE